VKADVPAGYVVTLMAWAPCGFVYAVLDPRGRAARCAEHCSCWCQVFGTLFRLPVVVASVMFLCKF